MNDGNIIVFHSSATESLSPCVTQHNCHSRQRSIWRAMCQQLWSYDTFELYFPLYNSFPYVRSTISNEFCNVKRNLPGFEMSLV